ncbi:cupin domain-containing protein [Phenylobacterium sp.]|uniref:cupin domain-containing protein n=1 Tax=Phenylobacterium sp. TaxID=1871053 RepID=UPI0035264492
MVRNMIDRPPFIAHWSELESPEPHRYAGDDEPMGLDASLGRQLGLTRIGIHHVRLLPGRRTSYPHAESAEEEFVFVVQGRPDAWIDGILHPLKPGDSVAFPSGTGICHTFLNNTEEEVRLLVIGEKRKPENRGRYPLNPEVERDSPYAWLDAPARLLGPHDGQPRKSTLDQ